MDIKGKIVWRLLFGIVMAALLIGILITYTYTQRQFAEEEEAQNLADDLSKTAFSAIDRQERSLDLPIKVGDSQYRLEVAKDQNEFQIEILDSEGENKKFRSTAGVDLENIGGVPDPGEKIYFRGDGEKVFYSENSIESLPSDDDGGGIEYDYPENFYEKNKNNPEETTGLIYAYFYVRDRVEGDANIEGYKWTNPNKLLVNVSGETYTVEWKNKEGEFSRKEITNISENGSPPEGGFEEPNYSIKEAYESGYIYSPTEAKSNIMRRTWEDSKGNIVELSNINFEDDITAARITTDVSNFSSWRLEFEDHTFYHGTMPWRHNDSDPGFLLYSIDDLEVV